MKTRYTNYDSKGKYELNETYENWNLKSRTSYKSGIKSKYEKFNYGNYLEVSNYSNGNISNKTLYDGNGNKTEYRAYKNKKMTSRKTYTYGYNDKQWTYNSKGKLVKYYDYDWGTKKEYRTYYSNGTLHLKYVYDWDGKIKKRNTYKNKKLQYIDHYFAGKRSKRVYYKNGKVTGSSNVSNSNQNQLSKDKTGWINNIKNGTGIKSYYKNGVLVKEYKYESGKKTDYLTYHSNGKKKSDISYYSNGKIVDRSSYDSNGYITDYRQYTSKGVLTMNRDYYSKGIRKVERLYYSNGKRKAYTKLRTNGSIIETESYNTKGVRTDHKKYNSAKKKTYDYDYYSNGKIKLRIINTYDKYNNLVSKRTSKYNSSGTKTSDVTEKYNSNDNNTTGNIKKYFKMPLKSGVITCRYRCYSGHTGIDIGSSNGAKTIYASAPGTVIGKGTSCSKWGGYIGNRCNGGQGNYLVIYHKVNGRNYFTVYMHLSDIYVNIGSKVGYSTKIAKMGNSGNTSGMHLHFEVFEDTDKDQYRWDETITNPENLVSFSGLSSRNFEFSNPELSTKLKEIDGFVKEAVDSGAIDIYDGKHESVETESNYRYLN